MAKVYFTLAGVNHYFGSDFMKKGMEVKLTKEPDNKHDKEAIRVEMEGLGKVGYVANSSFTVMGDSMSAGRLYDKIAETATDYSDRPLAEQKMKKVTVDTFGVDYGMPETMTPFDYMKWLYSQYGLSN